MKYKGQERGTILYTRYRPLFFFMPIILNKLKGDTNMKKVLHIVVLRARTLAVWALIRLLKMLLGVNNG